MRGAISGGRGEGELVHVALVKSGNTELGLHVSFAPGQDVIVEGVATHGAAAKWNASMDTAHQINPGDQIVRVNGVQDDEDNMMKELSQCKDLCITLKRAASGQKSSSAQLPFRPSPPAAKQQPQGAKGSRSKPSLTATHAARASSLGINPYATPFTSLAAQECASVRRTSTLPHRPRSSARSTSPSVATRRQMNPPVIVTQRPHHTGLMRPPPPPPQHPPPQPGHFAKFPEKQAGNSFNITLQKMEEGDELGVEIYWKQETAGRYGLVVGRIFDGGLFESWNSFASPMYQVRAGDFIVDVNGITTENFSGMMSELETKSELKLTILPVRSSVQIVPLPSTGPTLGAHDRQLQ